jgi:general secretion pathway protein I
MTRRGFTLLEVMVAVTILGLGLTLILSSQAGMFASTKRIEAETYAVNLLRCKMGELEIYLEKNGYPLIDQNDSGDCCEDEDIPGYTCDWKIETVELLSSIPKGRRRDKTGRARAGRPRASAPMPPSSLRSP